RSSMIPYFQLLCIAGMLYPIHALNLNVLQVKGRSDLFLYLEIIKTIVPTVLIFIVIWMDWGILALVATVVLDSYISLFINIYFSGREIDRKSTRLNSSHVKISYAVFCL